MSKLLFLQNLEYEYMGPMYVSSMLMEHGHETRLAIGSTFEEIEGTISRFAPDLVGFSIMSGSHKWARGIGAQVKRAFGIPTIYGGAHPTFFPDFTRDEGVDITCVGEGEEACLELLDRIEAGRDYADVENLQFVRDGKLHKNPVRRLRSHLDDYPYPDRRLYDSLNGRIDRSVRNVITSRGCPFHCSFCFEDAMRETYAGKGKYVRIRSIEKVLEECRFLRDREGARVIYFADDVFGMSKSWLYRFLPEYRREVGLPFVCLVRADILASDEEYAFRMAEGGCQSVFFGIESGREELRNRVLGKQLTDAQIYRAADLLHRAGIKFRTYNIVGLPGETLEDALSTVQMNIDVRSDYPWCSVFMPFPGTELSRYAVEHGYLDPTFEVETLRASFFTESSLQNMPDLPAMQNLQKLFQTAVRWPFTFPLIRRLIHLKPNRLFQWWFGLVYFYLYVRSERRGFWSTLRFVLRNYRRFLE